MRKLKSLMAMIAAMASVRLEGDYRDGGNNPLKPEDISVAPKKDIVPAGCKRYVFNHNGEEVSFIAMKRENAEKKFNKWKQSKV